MFYERPNLLFLTCRLSLDFMLNEQKMPAFGFCTVCILLEIMEQGKWFRCSQPWLFGIFESQKHCLLNIHVRSKFSYLEYSVLLLETEKMKDACLWDGMWPRSLGGWGWSLYFPSYARVHMKIRTCSFSSRAGQESVESNPVKLGGVSFNLEPRSKTCL